eukprot:scaffold1659_cov255-Pinguiococcus_pyrenoidosus.AAC.6
MESADDDCSSTTNLGSFTYSNVLQNEESSRCTSPSPPLPWAFLGLCVSCPGLGSWRHLWHHATALGGGLRGKETRGEGGGGVAVRRDRRQPRGSGKEEQKD